MEETEANKEITDIGELYPELTPMQRAEAEYFLTRYVEIVRSIYERVNGLTGKNEGGRF
jgi:hypothetical protein